MPDVMEKLFDKRGGATCPQDTCETCDAPIPEWTMDTECDHCRGKDPES